MHYKGSVTLSNARFKMNDSSELKVNTVQYFVEQNIDLFNIPQALHIYVKSTNERRHKFPFKMQGF